MLGAAELLAGISGEGVLDTAEIRKWLDNPANHAPLEFELPMWLQPWPLGQCASGRGQ